MAIAEETVTHWYPSDRLRPGALVEPERAEDGPYEPDPYDPDPYE